MVDLQCCISFMIIILSHSQTMLVLLKTNQIQSNLVKIYKFFFLLFWTNRFWNLGKLQPFIIYFQKSCLTLRHIFRGRPYQEYFISGHLWEKVYCSLSKLKYLNQIHFVGALPISFFTLRSEIKAPPWWMTLVTAYCRKNTSVQFSRLVVSDSL